MKHLRRRLVPFGRSGAGDRPLRLPRPMAWLAHQAGSGIGPGHELARRVDSRAGYLHRIADCTAKVEQGVSQASLVAILQAPKTVHTTSQAAITATARAVDSGSKYDES